MSDKKKKEHNDDEATAKKNAAPDAVQQWVVSLTEVVNKTIPKLTEKAGKVSEQLNNNPVFNDIKQRIIETGKKAGEKLGLSAEFDAASKSPVSKPAAASASSSTVKKTKPNKAKPSAKKTKSASSKAKTKTRAPKKKDT